ncbi:MAG: HNH endonuclease [Selenomonadaceae bacterium]|nr:HNH endonuclease [Selenomonadaceae bacterium]
MDGKFILTKIVDWSLLNRGFAIPVDMQVTISLNLENGQLKHGEKRKITIIFDNESHIATLSSVNFDKTKYPDHKDIWQINYAPNGTFAKKVKVFFNKSYATLSEMRKFKRDKRLIKIPNEEQESIAFYTTDIKNTFYIEPIFNYEVNIPQKERDENLIENLLDVSTLTDSQAQIVEKYHLSKIRRVNRGIGEYLKELYSFRCQICGEKVGSFYSVKVAECHHIDYFVKSLNNDANNLLIVCPNHHRIIHISNPKFDKESKEFLYPNGYVEHLKLNLHL